jgi:DNA-binding LacI/PurR family transcriptional regulator
MQDTYRKAGSTLKTIQLVLFLYQQKIKEVIVFRCAKGASIRAWIDLHARPFCVIFQTVTHPITTMQIPKRITLVSQTAEALRQEIAAGHWRNQLPGERSLAGQFQIARVTLRTAIQQLRREGLIQLVGQRYRVRNPAAARSPRRRSRAVAFLTTIPHHLLPLFKLAELANLQRLIQDAGLKLEIVFDPRLAEADNPSARLRQLVAATDAACWVLSSCHASVQRWFMEQPVPAIVTGTRHEGIRLPAVDFDNRAIARHAAGTLLARGHRRVALMLPDSGLAGDRATEQGFREAFASGQHADAEPVVWFHDGTAGGICRALAPFEAGREGPTAVLVSHVQHVLTVLTRLLAHGVHVPREVSLLCLRSDPDLAFLVPSIACYDTDPVLFSQRLGRQTIQLAATGSLRLRQTLIVGRMHPGGSLENPPARP